MRGKSQSTELRSFGLLVGGVFSIIGLWPLLPQSDPPRLWAIVLGAGFFLLGLFLPNSLKWPHRLWMKVGHVLGWVNTRIILGIIFYGLITPMGVLKRVMGKDSMRRALVQEADTYRVLRTARPASHIKRQF